MTVDKGHYKHDFLCDSHSVTWSILINMPFCIYDNGSLVCPSPLVSIYAPSPSASKQQRQQEWNLDLFGCEAFAPCTIPAIIGISTEGNEGPLSI